MTLETALKGAFDDFVATKTTAQITIFRKAFAAWVGEDDYTNINTTIAGDKIASVIKTKARAINEEETAVTYTDLDTDA